MHVLPLTLQQSIVTKQQELVMMESHLATRSKQVDELEQQQRLLRDRPREPRVRRREDVGSSEGAERDGPSRLVQAKRESGVHQPPERDVDT